MDYKKIFVVAILMIGFGQVQAQFRLPSFDASLKVSYLTLWDQQELDGRTYDYTLESLGWHGEVNLQFGQRVAVGWFYGHSLVSNYHNKDAGSIDLKGEHLTYGANVRLSGGRSSRFRPYVQMKYFWLEAVIEQSGYRTAADMKGITGGIGLMLRVNHKLYVNLIDAEISSPFKHDGLIFKIEDNRVFPQLRAGLTYNFSKRK